MANLVLRYGPLHGMKSYSKYVTISTLRAIVQDLVIVRELMGWVRNVVLMNVYLDLENPGGSGFWVGGYMSQEREWGS